MNKWKNGSANHDEIQLLWRRVSLIDKKLKVCIETHICVQLYAKTNPKCMSEKNLKNPTPVKLLPRELTVRGYIPQKATGAAKDAGIKFRKKNAASDAAQARQTSK